MCLVPSYEKVGGERPPQFKKGKGARKFKKVRRFLVYLSHRKDTLLRGVEVVYKCGDHATISIPNAHQKALHKAPIASPSQIQPVVSSLDTPDLRGPALRTSGVQMASPLDIPELQASDTQISGVPSGSASRQAEAPGSGSSDLRGRL